MSKCTKVRTLALLAMNVCIAAPLLAHAQPTSEVEISCDTGDSLQAALAALAPGGRIVIRSGTCTGNLSLSRDVRIQGAGYDLVTIKAADASLPVVTVPRGVTATISGVTISGGRVGLWNAGRVSLSFSRVSENTSGGIEIRDRGYLEGDKIKVVRNTGPGITILGAEAMLRGSVIAPNVTGGGGGGMRIVGGRAELVGTQIEDNEAIRDGGGLLATGKGLLVLDRVRLFRNKARTGHGGAIAVNASTAEISGSSLFAHLAAANDLGVGHTVGCSECFLGRERNVVFDIEALTCVAARVDGPRREGEQLALLVLRRETVGLREPPIDRLVLAGNDSPLGEEVARECSPRRSLDHLLETAARNHLGVNVDAVLDQGAKDAFVGPIAGQPPGDAVCLDDPQRERVALPHRFEQQGPHLHDGEHVAVFHDALDELS